MSPELDLRAESPSKGKIILSMPKENAMSSRVQRVNSYYSRSSSLGWKKLTLDAFLHVCQNLISVYIQRHPSYFQLCEDQPPFL